MRCHLGESGTILPGSFDFVSANAWEQRKVGELLTERNTQAPKSEEYPLMAFMAYEGVAPKGDRYNREFLVNDEANKKYKQTEYGDFIYSSNNLETGSIGLNNYGKASISPVYSIFQTTELSDSDFIGRLLVRKNFINKMVRWRQGVIYGQWRIHESDFIRIEVTAPSANEQQKIGAFFANLDHLITLHQREYDKTVNIKKAMLEKMFPKDGEDKPEIRFAGFTDAWEQRKVGDHAEILTGGTPRTTVTEFWEPKEIPWMSSGEVNKRRLDSTDNMISKAGLENSSARWVKANSVLIALAGQGKTRGMVAINSIPLTTNQSIAAIVPDDSLHYEFVYQSLLQRYDELRMVSSGDGTRGGLNKQLVSDVFISCPSTDEQKQISSLFASLDHLITLHQRECEKLQNIKKSLLEKMFV
jgi:type I restriction enzyme S subunit